jgi:hypothetical protein
MGNIQFVRSYASLDINKLTSQLLGTPLSKRDRTKSLVPYKRSCIGIDKLPAVVTALTSVSATAMLCDSGSGSIWNSKAIPDFGSEKLKSRSEDSLGFSSLGFGSGSVSCASAFATARLNSAILGDRCILSCHSFSWAFSRRVSNLYRLQN